MMKRRDFLLASAGAIVVPMLPKTQTVEMIAASFADPIVFESGTFTIRGDTQRIIAVGKCIITSNLKGTEA
jgi:hypothetical protein